MPFARSHRAITLLFLLLLFCAGPVAADSWMPPSVRTYASADGRHRLTVTPRGIESPLAYFDDAVKGRERPGQAADRPGEAAGRLERLEANGRWTKLWERKLVNDVAPVEAVVSNDGRFVATFDDWHFVGTGEHVVVIYGGDGSPIRSLRLKDLLPLSYIKALPHSVSSIGWRGDARILGDRLIVPIVLPSDTSRSETRSYVDLEIELASGNPLPTTGPAWQAALLAGEREASAREAAEKAQAAAFRALLLGPLGTDEPAWHHYLREAYFRLDADWEEGFPATHVLSPPTDRSGYRASAKGLREDLTDRFPAPAIMIASPAAPEQVAVLLVETSGRIKPGALRETRLYAVVPKPSRDRVAAALARSGATLVWLDPATQVPQRRERLRAAEE